MEKVPIQITSGATLTLKDDDIPFGAYQAIYHKLTRRVERDRKFYSGAYSISFGDIENFHQRLRQSIKQYQTKAERCEVIHSIRNESTRFHSSFEKFKINSVHSTLPTSRLAYEFDFLIVLPPEIEQASEIAQRYKLTLVLDQDLYNPDEDLFMMPRVPDINNIELNVEFSDYSVYQSLRAVVDEWVSHLPRREPTVSIKTIKKFDQHLRPATTLAAPPIFRGRSHAIRQKFGGN